MAGTTTEPSERAPNPGRQILIIGAVLLALVVGTVVTVLAVGSREESYPPGTPEGALQRYLQAFEDEDFETAYSYFSSEVQDEMSLDEFEEATEYYGSPAPEIERRVRVDRVEETDDGAVVHLTVEEFYGGGGPFGGGGTYSYPREVRMVREGGDWKIDEPLLGLEPGPFPEFEDAEEPPRPAP